MQSERLRPSLAWLAFGTNTTGPIRILRSSRPGRQLGRHNGFQQRHRQRVRLTFCQHDRAASIIVADREGVAGAAGGWPAAVTASREARSGAGTHLVVIDP